MFRINDTLQTNSPNLIFLRGKEKKCTVFLIRVVFNKHFDIIPSSPEDDVSELHRKLGTN